jgi:hypothetical protein
LGPRGWSSSKSYYSSYLRRRRRTVSSQREMIIIIIYFCQQSNFFHVEVKQRERTAVVRNASEVIREVFSFVFKWWFWTLSTVASWWRLIAFRRNLVSFYAKNLPIMSWWHKNLFLFVSCACFVSCALERIQSSSCCSQSKSSLLYIVEMINLICWNPKDDSKI